MATQKQKVRKQGTLNRLKNVLTVGTKPLRIEAKRGSKKYITSKTEKTILTDQDRKRISTEISNLEKKLGFV